MKYLNISRRTFILLLLNLVLIPLVGNDHMFNYLNLSGLDRFLMFLIPALYFFSFAVDFYKGKTTDTHVKIDLRIVSLLVFSLVLILSFLLSIVHNFHTITNFIQFFYIILYILTIHITKLTDEQEHKIIQSILFLFILICSIGIFQYMFQINLITRGIQKFPGALGRISSTMSISTILDKYITINFLFLYYLLYKKYSAKLWIYICLLLGILALAFTFGRNSILVFYFISTIFTFLYVYKKQFTNLITVVLIIILLNLIPGQKYLLSSSVHNANIMLNTFLEKINLTQLSPINNYITSLFSYNLITDDSETVIDDINKDNDENDDDKSKDKKVGPPFTDHKDASLESRKKYENVAQAILKEYPLTGIGIGSYVYIYKNQNINDFLNTNKEYRNYLYPHNFYLHFAAEVGYLGLLSFILIFLTSIISNIKNKNVLLPTLYLISIILFCVTESLFYMKEISFFIIVTYCLSSKKLFASQR